MTRRKGIDRRTHVKQQGLDLVRVHVADAGDHLLVDVRGEGVPGALGRKALEQRALVVDRAVANNVDSPFLNTAGVLLGSVIRLAWTVAGVVPGGGLAKPPLPAGVADQRIDRVPGRYVVEAPGMLRDAAMQVGHRLLAVTGELLGDVQHVRSPYPGQLTPFIEGARLGGLVNDLQHTFNPDPVHFGIHEQLAFRRRFLVVGIEGCIGIAGFG